MDPTLKFGHEPGRWVACEYAVRKEEKEKILQYFGVTPQIDAFASAENALFERWWGPGSTLGENAFLQDWSKELLLLNPPFDVMDRVLDKIHKEKAHALLVVPA